MSDRPRLPRLCRLSPAATVLLSSALLVGGCATSGMGTGQLQSPAKPDSEGPVSFRWRTGMNTSEGDISAVLPDGREFSGRFMQVTSATVSQHLDAWSPVGAPYYGGGRGGAYWEPVDATSFATYYSGRIIAQLQGPDGEAIRCMFVLEDPVAGPQSGGLGDCQLSTGERIGYARLVGDDD